MPDAFASSDLAAGVTLDTCASEPIHIPGSIQPHGALLACRGERLAVEQVSDNVEAWLGAAAPALLGRSLLELLDAASGALLQAALRAEDLREYNPMRLARQGGAAFAAVLHRAGEDLVVVELEEPGDEGPGMYVGFDPRLRTSVLRLQGTRDIAALCRVAAEQIREITGFDRVMVYRFDADWNGEVVAECKRDDLEPFFGLHYPASDIPAQARRLYTVNWLRLIVDIAYRPSLLVPAHNPTTGAPLDLTHATLRSVSPIHVEYLTNMGVTASMSVSLVIDGVLAGLIACHHYSGPKRVDYRQRDTAEFLGQALSWQLRVLEAAEAAERARFSAGCEAEVVRAVVTNPELLEGLASPALLRLTAATGAAIVLQDGVRKLGECPPQRELMALVDWLAERGDDTFATDHLAADVPVAIGEGFAGLLAVTLSLALREYILWFRPPTVRTVDWAGDPRKSVQVAEGQPARLSPRGSFALWRETVRGRSAPWQSWHIDPASHLRRSLLGGMRLRVAQLREINQRLLDADRVKDDFIATVSHELRTPLNAILGWTQLLQNTSILHEKGAYGLEVIGRNAQAQARIIDDLLDVSRMVGGKLSLVVDSVDLVALVTSVLDSLEVAIGAKQLRVRRILDTTTTLVLGDAARLHQIVWNLIGNAIKFTPRDGSITVALRRTDSEVELTVRDSGEGIAEELLPLVFDMFRQGDAGMNRRSRGLGIGLAIARKLTELHGGRIVAESDGPGRGATFRVILPISPVRRAEPTSESSSPVLGGVLSGVHVLVVEDEDDARELIGDLLRMSGATVEAAADADTALAMLGVKRFDVVVSDVGMPGKDGYELMRQIRGRAQGGPPAVALTAYNRVSDRTTALQAGFNAHIPKPVDASELVTVVASVVGRLGR